MFLKKNLCFLLDCFDFLSYDLQFPGDDSQVRRHSSRALRHGDLCESVFGQDVLGLRPVLVLDEQGHDVAVLLVHGDEQLTHIGHGRCGIALHGTDHRHDTLVTRVLIDVDRQSCKELEILLLCV